MQTSLWRKGIVFGIMILFLVTNIGSSDESSSNLMKNDMPTTSNGDTLYVGGDGPGNYSCIQDAIDNASIMDTIFVFSLSSPYYENIIIKKNGINLIGEDKKTTIIDGNSVGDVVHINTKEVKIQGFTIQNSGLNFYSYNHDAGVSIYHSPLNTNVTVTDTVITNNSVGIHLSFAQNNIIFKNIIINNKYGIHVIGDSPHNTFSENIIENNSYAIDIHLSDDQVITNNSIAHNSQIGINIIGSGSNTIQNNNFIDNGDDVYFYIRLNIDKKPARWINNYWDTWNGYFPMLIKGRATLWLMGYIQFPWFNFDWRPAQEPYDI